AGGARRGAERRAETKLAGAELLVRVERRHPPPHRGAHPVLGPDELLAAHEHLVGDAPGDDHDAVPVADDDVAQRHPYAADRHRLPPVTDPPATHRVLRPAIADERREAEARD